MSCPGNKLTGEGRPVLRELQNPCESNGSGILDDRCRTCLQWKRRRHGRDLRMLCKRWLIEVDGGMIRACRGDTWCSGCPI